MKKWLIFTALFTALLIGCASSTAGGVVGANRGQILLIDAKQMDQSAALAYTQVIDNSKANGTLDTDKELNARVQNVVARLIKQVGAFRQDALKWDWQAHVIASDELNAWCMPGGRIAVYSGIIKRLNLSDAELAAVLGHEMAHALREHGRERASQEQLKSLGLGIIAKVAGLTGVAQMGMEVATKYAIMLPFSRTHESEADAIGTELMALAGYDPKAAISVWQKMQKASSTSNKLPEILSTHPSSQTRIKELTQIAQKLQDTYKKSLAKTEGI